MVQLVHVDGTKNASFKQPVKNLKLYFELESDFFELCRFLKTFHDFS
jgi:hypothetical protein